MKQVAKLKLFFLLSIISGLIVIVVQLFQLKSIKNANYEQGVVFELVEKISKLELILHKISQNQEDKELIDNWIKQHKDLTKFLAYAERSVRNKDGFIKIQDKFIELRQHIANMNWEQEVCAITLASMCTKERSFENVLQTTSELLISVLEFAKRAKSDANEHKYIIYITSVSFGAAVTFALIFLALFLGRRIVYSINFLQNGTYEVAQGNLDYRLEDIGEDEFGDLARHFNNMMDQLQLVIASKAQLNEEIIKREKIEKELKEHQLYLENRVASEVEIVREKDVQLLKQARSAQMGEMLTNIAHHWRQPLNVIGLYIQEIKDAKKYGELTDDYLNELVSKAMVEITNVSKTLDKFKKFSGIKSSEEKFTIGEVIEKSIDLIRPMLISSFIDIDLNTTGEKTKKCFGNESSLMRAIYNILINSKEALENNHIKKRKITIGVTIEDNLSKISISDNAGGIGEEIISRVFDPFFTTKGNVNKTGTGLYFTKMIIENEFNGKIDVRNITDGVEFLITIPNNCKDKL